MTLLTPMTGQDIIDRFQDIVDDAVESDEQALFLLNVAKDAIETEHDWYFLRSIDTSTAVVAGDNYLSMKTLPTDFLFPIAFYLQNDISPLIIIGLQQRDRYKDIYKRYYIDYKNRQFALCGNNSGPRGIIIHYGAQSPAIALDTAPTWPTAFHPYLAFKMAEMWGSGEDADEINFKMSRENLRQGNELLKAMKLWDARLKLIEYNAKNERHADLSSYPDVVGDQYI